MVWREIAVGEYDRNDGFSPGSTVIVHVPGLDNAAAFQRTAPVRLSDLSQAYAPAQPVVLIDEHSGARQRGGDGERGRMRRRAPAGRGKETPAPGIFMVDDHRALTARSKE